MTRISITMGDLQTEARLYDEQDYQLQARRVHRGVWSDPLSRAAACPDRAHFVGWLALVAQVRIERFAQAIAEQVESQNSHEDHRARRHDQPRGQLQVLEADLDH